MPGRDDHKEMICCIEHSDCSHLQRGNWIYILTRRMFSIMSALGLGLRLCLGTRVGVGVGVCVWGHGWAWL